MKLDKSFFGKEFKYILILTILAWMVYSLPQVKESMSRPVVSDPATSSVAAVGATSVATCPGGYICIPISRANSYCPAGYTCTQTATTSQPYISLNASSTNIGLGQSTVVFWSTNNVTNCVGTQDGGDEKVPAIFSAPATRGSFTVTPSQSVTYTLACSFGTVGKMSKSVTINVGQYQSSWPSSISATINSATPLKGLVQISETVPTSNVSLMVFNLKSTNGTSTLRQIKLSVQMSTSSPDARLFNNMKLKAGGNIYSAFYIYEHNNIADVVFSDMSITLPSNATVAFILTADIAADLQRRFDGVGIRAYLQADKSSIYAEYGARQLPVNMANITGNTLTLVSNSPIVSNLSTLYGVPTTNGYGSTTQKFSFRFAITANADPIYLSRSLNSAISTSTVPNPSNIFISPISFSDTDASGDGPGYLYIAPGQTKTFTAIYSGSGQSSAVGTFNVSAINYGTSSDALTSASITSSQITNGLKAVLFH
jgi:hypothetical protein